MDELRSEIRAAFEKEQSDHPPIGGLRSSLSIAAAAQTRPTRNLQWIAVAVAAVLGVLVVAGLVSTRLAPRGNVPGNTKATPVADYGPPPAGVPLLYVHDPNNPSWLIGFDWSGKPRGTVKLAADLGADPSQVRMAPDGSGFEVGETIKGGTGIFLDRLGQRVATDTGPSDVAGTMWADDNRHKCLITISSAYVWGLATRLPGQVLQPVAVLARDPGVGQSGISLAACSYENNLAIAVRTTIAWPAEVWVVRLSDGAIVAHHKYPVGGGVNPGGGLNSVVASPDGKYMAENSAKGSKLDGSSPSVSPASTIIRRVSDWQVVKKLDPALQVMRFSGDGSLVLAAKLQPLSPGGTLSLLNWSTGSIVWQREIADPFVVAVLAQPTGRDFAFAFVTVGGQDLTATISIVHGDGSATQLPGSYEAAW
jgi:hypothetical protein